MYDSLVFQNPPVIPCEDRCLEPQKAEPQEVFRDPNTYSQGIWKTRDWKTRVSKGYFFSGTIPSLELTAKAPETRPSKEESVVSQPSIFSGYVSFREGKWPKINGFHWGEKTLHKWRYLGNL